MRRKQYHLTKDQSIALGGKLRATREQQGRTQNFIALAAGISKSYLSAIEHGGKANPTTRRMRVIADSLDIDLDVLVEEVRKEFPG